MVAVLLPQLLMPVVCLLMQVVMQLVEHRLLLQIVVFVSAEILLYPQVQHLLCLRLWVLALVSVLVLVLVMRLHLVCLLTQEIRREQRLLGLLWVWVWVWVWVLLLGMLLAIACFLKQLGLLLLPPELVVLMLMASPLLVVLLLMLALSSPSCLVHG